MTAVKSLVYQLELNFWNIAIPLLETSSVVRFIIPRIYALMNPQTAAATFLSILFVLGAGMLMGFVFGVLSQLL